MPKIKRLACYAGFEVLTAMEKVRTDDDDRPKQEIKITGATVFVNPYKDEEEAERKAAEEARLKVTSRHWPESAIWQGSVKAGWIKLKHRKIATLYARCNIWRTRDLSAPARRKERTRSRSLGRDIAGCRSCIDFLSPCRKADCHPLQQLGGLATAKTQCLGLVGCIAG